MLSITKNFSNRTIVIEIVTDIYLNGSNDYILLFTVLLSCLHTSHIIRILAIFLLTVQRNLLARFDFNYPQNEYQIFIAKWCPFHQHGYADKSCSNNLLSTTMLKRKILIPAIRLFVTSLLYWAWIRKIIFTIISLELETFLYLYVSQFGCNSIKRCA